MFGIRTMGSEIEIVEERLKSFLGQLKTEYGIFDRIVYKNKNQHRRCSYFQYLLKVRRDLRLLQSTKLEEILNSCFLVIHGKKPKQKVQLLESLKRRKCDSGKYNFLERLLGAARLLSRMVEPMLRAATSRLVVRIPCFLVTMFLLALFLPTEDIIKAFEQILLWRIVICFLHLTINSEISKLLAQSFFMGFSLTNLALLSRFRVLIQQILLDVVYVFNIVFPLSQKKQSIKITEEGLEVFRDYYPTKEPNISLECIWETDKFVLVEKRNESENKSQGKAGENVSIGASTIQYQSIEVLLGDNDDVDKADQEPAPEIYDYMIKDIDSLGDPQSKSSEENSLASAGGSNMPSSSSLYSNPLKRKAASTKKVAFLSVAAPAPSTADKMNSPVKLADKVDEQKEDPFFSLLTGGNKKSSIF